MHVYTCILACVVAKCAKHVEWLCVLGVVMIMPALLACNIDLLCFKGACACGLQHGNATSVHVLLANACCGDWTCVPLWWQGQESLCLTSGYTQGCVQVWLHVWMCAHGSACAQTCAYLCRCIYFHVRACVCACSDVGMCVCVCAIGLGCVVGLPTLLSRSAALRKVLQHVYQSSIGVACV